MGGGGGGGGDRGEDQRIIQVLWLLIWEADLE